VKIIERFSVLNEKNIVVLNTNKIGCGLKKYILAKVFSVCCLYILCFLYYLYENREFCVLKK